MPIDLHPFIGATDTDSPDLVIGRGVHKEARNLIFRGPRGNKRAENIPGTTQLPNPFLPNTGINKNIGRFYDSIYYRIITWNYNSLGNHGIYVFYTQTQTWNVLIQNGSSTDGDILGFTASGLITSIDILYNNSVDGNLLFFLDSLGRPTCFNIERYLNTPYTLIKRAFIDLIKAPFQMSPKCVYENDYTVTINNLQNSLYQFKSRPVYDDYQKSVYGSGSAVAIPYVNSYYQTPPTFQSARIGIYVPTGDADVQKIEIWGRQVIDQANTTAPSNDQTATPGDYFLIVSLDKATLGIPDNDIYRFVFYNDATYTPGDIREETLLQDWVPLYGNAMQLLNGNVPGIGGVTEGYDIVPLLTNITANVSQQPPISTYPGVLFFAAQGLVDSGGTGNILKIFYSGSGGNNIDNTPASTPTIMANMTVNVATATGANISFSFLNEDVDPGIALTLVSLGAAATAQGFTIVSLTETAALGYVLELSYPSPIVLYGSTLTSVQALISAIGPNIVFAYPHQSFFQFALQYFDNRGRTNGAMLPVSGGINTPEDQTGLSLPQIIMSITNQPPLWAAYYDIVRTNSLSYNKHLFWVCNQTFASVDLNTNNKYAYIGISNMADYNANIEASTNVVTYEFQAGDRVRFLQLVSPGGTLSNVGPFDYEITALAVNPVLNGVIQQGNFLQILYPINNISAGFDFGPINLQNYVILIYSYVRHVADPNTQVYFEFNKRFGIGNAGTPQAFHISADQTQVLSTGTPALINLSDGTWFFRYRQVPYGGIYYFGAGNSAYTGVVYATFITQSPNGADVVTANYQISHQVQVPAVLDNTGYPLYTDINFEFWNTSAVSTLIRVSGSYIVETGAGKSTVTGVYAKVVTASTITIIPIVVNFDLAQGVDITTYNLTFDGDIPVPAGAKVWIINQNANAISEGAVIRIGAFTMRLDVLDLINIPIIESSYSDKYNIVTNSNSRPSVYDSTAEQRFYPVRMRWGLSDILNTQINNTNRFYFQDYDEFDPSHGSIIRIRARQKETRIFQQRRCGRVGVFNKFVRDNSGENILTTTDVIITQNNIQYYEGEFGIANQPSSLVSSGYVDYFIDCVRGRILRLSLDGITDISELYKVQTWAGANLPGFLDPTPYQFGGNNAIVGCFNFTPDRESELIFVLQGNESFAFNEVENSWTSYYDFVPDSIVTAENVLYSFFNGQLYIHNNQSSYCNFYGVQYKPSIIIPYNEQVTEKKTWIGIAQNSNVQWNSPLIYTEMNSYGTQRQESNLVDSDFQLLETEWSTSFLRDIHSLGGVGNGIALKGGFMVIQLTVTNGGQFVYLIRPKVKFINSPLNAR